MTDRFLLCEPRYFGIEYEINPWMKRENNIDYERARRQWDALYEKLSQLASVELIQPQPGLPDMVFTANAGLIFGHQQVILSNFKHPERKGEESLFKEWFLKAGYNVHEVQESFEGAGDCFLIQEHIYAGFNMRTSFDAYYEILPKLPNMKSVWCKLTDPYFYHLDTCFCPLRDSDALWYKNAFDKEHQAETAKLLNVIHVDEHEARQFACNAVIVNEEHVILPSGCSNTIDKLKQLNYTPHEVDMSEYLKSGGACKCLTLKLG